MSAQPLLTAVINVRNGAKFIRKTLESLRAQTCPISILVIDNHSTDGTPSIVLDFPEARYIKTPEPLTLGAARNFSLNHVETPFVAWLDADDLWEPAFADRTVSAFKQSSEPVMVTGGTIVIDSEGRDVGLLHPWSLRYRIFRAPIVRGRVTQGDTLRQVLHRMRPRWAWCAHAFCTATVREVGGFDSRWTYAEDLEIVLKVLAKGISLHVPENLSRHRLHSDQDTRTQRVENIYGEKLAVVSLLGSRSGLLTEPQIRRLETVTRFKSSFMRCFRTRARLGLLRSLAYLFHPHIWRYSFNFLAGRST